MVLINEPTKRGSNRVVEKLGISSSGSDFYLAATDETRAGAPSETNHVVFGETRANHHWIKTGTQIWQQAMVCICLATELS